MPFKLASFTVAAAAAATSSTPPPAEEEEYYSSWSLFLVCILLTLSLWTSYYLQIKRIRAVHETLVSIFAGMAVGLIVRLAPGTMIREMLVSAFVSLHGVDIWAVESQNKLLVAFLISVVSLLRSEYLLIHWLRHLNIHCFSTSSCHQLY